MMKKIIIGLIVLLAVAIILSESYFLKNDSIDGDDTERIVPYIPPNCEKVEVFVAGGDAVDWCSIAENETRTGNTCFRRLEEGVQTLEGGTPTKYGMYNTSQCTLLNTRCRRQNEALGTEFYCYFSCCR